MYKILFWISIFNIVLFLIPFGIIGVADFSENRGTTKSVAMFYYVLMNFVFVLPALVSLFVRKRKLLFILLALNIFSFGWLLYQLVAYLRSLGP